MSTSCEIALKWIPKNTLAVFYLTTCPSRRVKSCLGRVKKFVIIQELCVTCPNLIKMGIRMGAMKSLGRILPWWEVNTGWGNGLVLLWYLNQNSNIFIHENTFENVIWKMAAILPRPQCVKNSLILAVIAPSCIKKRAGYLKHRIPHHRHKSHGSQHINA